MNEHLERLTELLKRTTFKDYLALIILLGSYVFLYLLLKLEMPDKNKEILYVAVGNMFGVVTTVVSFYFGSSKDKSDSDKAYNIQKVAQASVLPEAVMLDTLDVAGLKAKYKELSKKDCPDDLTREEIIDLIKKL